METAKSPDTTVAAPAEVRGTTSCNQFVWGILFAVVSFGMISGEYTALKYISICAAALLCVWVTQQEEPALATVEDQLPAADEHGIDDVTEVSFENPTQLNAVTGALVLHGPAAPACPAEPRVATFDENNIDDAIEEFIAELTLLEHIDSTKGALVLYRPLSYFLPDWVNSLPETIDRDWVEFPAPTLPKPCDSVDPETFFGPHNPVSAHGEKNTPVFPEPAEYSPAAQPGYDASASFRTFLEANHDLGFDEEGRLKHVEVIQTAHNPYLYITNIPGTWVFRLQREGGEDKHLVIRWIQDKQAWWCEDYGVCFAFEDDATGNQACTPVYAVAYNPSDAPVQPEIWNQDNRENGPRPAGPWWEETWNECMAAAAMCNVDIPRDSYYDDVDFYRQNIVQQARSNDFSTLDDMQEYQIFHQFHLLVGEDACRFLLNALYEEKTVLLTKRFLSQLAENRSIEWIIENLGHHIDVLESYIGVAACQQFLDELSIKQEVRHLKEGITNLADQFGFEHLLQTPQKHRLEGLIGEEQYEQFFLGLQQEQIRALAEIQAVLDDAEEEWGETDAHSARETFAPQFMTLIDVEAPFSTQVRQHFLIKVREFAKDYGYDEAYGLYHTVVFRLCLTDSGMAADDFWGELDELEAEQSLHVDKQGVDGPTLNTSTTTSVPPGAEETHSGQETTENLHNDTSFNDAATLSSTVEPQEISFSRMVAFGSSTRDTHESSATYTFTFSAGHDAKHPGSFGSSAFSGSGNCSFTFSAPLSSSPASSVSTDTCPVPPMEELTYLLAKLKIDCETPPSPMEELLSLLTNFKFDDED